MIDESFCARMQWYHWLPAVGLLVLALSCGKQSVEPAVVIPDTVSFSRDVLPVFSRDCSLSGCHSGANPTGNLNLSASVAYGQLWKQKMIDTLHPEQSVLYIQLNSVSDPMPPSGRLPAGTIALIYKWIQQKAPNN